MRTLGSVGYTRQRPTVCEGPKAVEFIETESGMLVPERKGQGEGLVFDGYRFRFSG